MLIGKPDVCMTLFPLESIGLGFKIGGVPEETMLVFNGVPA